MRGLSSPNMSWCEDVDIAEAVVAVHKKLQPWGSKYNSRLFFLMFAAIQTHGKIFPASRKLPRVVTSGL